MELKKLINSVTALSEAITRLTNTATPILEYKLSDIRSKEARRLKKTKTSADKKSRQEEARRQSIIAYLNQISPLTITPKEVKSALGGSYGNVCKTLSHLVTEGLITRTRGQRGGPAYRGVLK